MKYKCKNCDALCEIPNDDEPSSYSCPDCNHNLSGSEEATGETSAAVGLIGGAALGAAIAGPVGAIIGGIAGALLGKDSKGVG